MHSTWRGYDVSLASAGCGVTSVACFTPWQLLETYIWYCFVRALYVMTHLRLSLWACLPYGYVIKQREIFLTRWVWVRRDIVCKLRACVKMHACRDMMVEFRVNSVCHSILFYDTSLCTHPLLFVWVVLPGFWVWIPAFHLTRYDVSLGSAGCGVTSIKSFTLCYSWRHTSVLAC